MTLLYAETRIDNKKKTIIMYYYTKITIALFSNFLSIIGHCASSGFLLELEGSQSVYFYLSRSLEIEILMHIMYNIHNLIKIFYNKN